MVAGGSLSGLKNDGDVKLPTGDSVAEMQLASLRMNAGYEIEQNIMRRGLSGEGTEDEKEEKRKRRVRAMARAGTGGKSHMDALREKMSDWRLDTHTDIDPNTGRLMVKDDNGVTREATIAEKVILEEQSHACSVGSAGEAEMGKYLRGETDVVPAGFEKSAKAWAEDRVNAGETDIDPNNMTRADYQRYVDSLPPHIRLQITDPIQLGSDLTVSSLLGPKSSDVDWKGAKASVEPILKPDERGSVSGPAITARGVQLDGDFGRALTGPSVGTKPTELAPGLARKIAGTPQYNQDLSAGPKGPTEAVA